MNENQDYQEVNLLEIVKKVMPKWWVIFLLMVISGSISYYVTSEYMVPEYKAKTTLFIGKESEVLAGISLSDFNLDNKLVVDYRELIKTRLVTSEVINRLSLETTNIELIDKLGIEIITDSRFMHVAFVDPLPERATLIVNTISEELADKAKTIVGVDNVQIVDYAEVPSIPISPNTRNNVMVAMVLGAIVAIGIIFIQMMVNNTIHSEEDMEKTFGVPVLGVIPKFKGEVRR